MQIFEESNSHTWYVLYTAIIGFLVTIQFYLIVSIFQIFWTKY